ncbi:MAG TPA: hypothetical protein VHW00_03600 [Thermoanaerobaculia bacterium]|nr:hypothetical protein [Thermoanaerobaculia bacterium]
MQSITNVPAVNVGRVVQDFIDDGAIKVLVEAAENGLYTVTASWTT